MVIKKDPRAILDMLSKPVDYDEDDFLDKLDKDVSKIEISKGTYAIVVK